MGALIALVAVLAFDGGPGWKRGQWVAARETPGKWRVYRVWSLAECKRVRDFDYQFKRAFYADPTFRRRFFADEGPSDESDRSQDAWVVRLGPADADATAYMRQVEEEGYPMILDRFAEDLTPVEDAPEQEGLW